MDASRSAPTEAVLGEGTFQRVPSLLGPIFEEAGTGDRQMREALFLTFNVDLGFFEARLLGQVRAAGAAVSVVADASVFSPDPRNVRSAGHGYALGLAAMNGAFHPKLTVLAGPHRALIGIGSGNLTIGGWHSNDEVLTTIHASRDDGVPAVIRDVVAFLDQLPQRVTISPLAREGIARTAAQLTELVDSGPPVDTGHTLVTSLARPIIGQLPGDHVDELEIAAPFHDVGGQALAALIRRYAPTRITVLAQPDQAVMDSAALQSAASRAGCDLRFVQLDGEHLSPGRYRHGKVITGLRAGLPEWSLVGSANATAAALLGVTPTGNCEIAILSRTSSSLLPTPTVPVVDVAALTKVIGPALDADGPGTSGLVRLLEARAVEGGIEVCLSGPTADELAVEISPYAASPDSFEPLGIIAAGESVGLFPGSFPAGSRVRIGDQLQFLAYADQVVIRMRPTGAGRPNVDATITELFTSDVTAALWHDALTRLLLTHSQGRAPTGDAAATTGHDSATASWRTLDDLDRWSDYADDALTRLGMPIFQLAAGSAATTKPVGSSLPNAAPAWEDHFDETTEAFEEDETAESMTAGDTESAVTATQLSPYQRSRLRKWIADLVSLSPHLGPLERIAVTQLAITGSAALIWEHGDHSQEWFTPLAAAVETMARDDWPAAVAEQAAAVTAVAVYRLGMAVPPDERGGHADSFRGLVEKVAPLLNSATADAVADNLDLLSGATLVERSADDVLDYVADAANARPDQATLRVLANVLPDLDIAWASAGKLIVSGRLTNPRAIAAQVFNHASSLDELAVGVNAHNGVWLVAAKVPDRITVVEGGKRPTTYRTYKIPRHSNPARVLTEPEFAQASRISTPPFTKPGNLDLEVLEQVGIENFPLTG